MPAQDTFESYQRGLNAPAREAFAISPDDSAELDYVTRAIYVGGGGDLEVVMLGGTQVTFQNLPAGTVLPCSIRQVRAQNTSATALIGLL